MVKKYININSKEIVEWDEEANGRLVETWLCLEVDPTQYGITEEPENNNEEPISPENDLISSENDTVSSEDHPVVYENVENEVKTEDNHVEEVKDVPETTDENKQVFTTVKTLKATANTSKPAYTKAGAKYNFVNGEWIRVDSSEAK